MSAQKVLIEEKSLQFNFMVPSEWKMLSRESFEKYGLDMNTLFLFFVEGGKRSVNVVFGGTCTSEEFDEAFRLNIENMKNAGAEIASQTSITSSNGHEFNLAIVKISDVVVAQVYIIVNGYLITFATNVIDVKDVYDSNEIMNNPCVSELVNVIFSISETEK